LSIRSRAPLRVGPTAVECADMLALIIVICLTAIQAVGALRAADEFGPRICPHSHNLKRFRGHAIKGPISRNRRRLELEARQEVLAASNSKFPLGGSITRGTIGLGSKVPDVQSPRSKIRQRRVEDRPKAGARSKEYGLNRRSGEGCAPAGLLAQRVVRALTPTE
jgi:hypothetical protein